MRLLNCYGAGGIWIGSDKKIGLVRASSLDAPKWTSIQRYRVVNQGNDAHFGLVGLSERARRIGGELEIRGQPGNGTEIELVLPLSSHQAAFGTR
jgi:hypothetical protein